MKFNFSANMPKNIGDASRHFDKNISLSLEAFIRKYSPHLSYAIMLQCTDNPVRNFLSTRDMHFTDNPVSNFLSLVDGISLEISRIKKEGKSDNPLASVKGVCSFQCAAYCHRHVPNAQRSIYWQMNTMLSRTHIWIHTTTLPGREAGLLML